MAPKDLVVFLEQDRDDAARLAYAAALAKRWQAHLIAVFVAQPLELEPHADFAIGPTALSSLLDEHRTRFEQALARARTAFDALTERRSFSAEWRLSDGESREALMLHARHASLAVLGPSARRRPATTLLDLSEDLILASGRPCLLLPDDWPAERSPRRIVVGWNGSREAARAIADATPFLIDAEAVHLVVVPETGVRGMLGAEPGADMATHLARLGIRVEVECLPGEDAGAALLTRCSSLDADLLVMGATARSRVSEIVFGGATRTVLPNARLPVLLSG